MSLQRIAMCYGNYSSSVGVAFVLYVIATASCTCAEVSQGDLKIAPREGWHGRPGGGGVKEMGFRPGPLHNGMENTCDAARTDKSIPVIYDSK